MVELLLHFTVPFAAFSSLGMNWRKVLFVSIAALAPDLDILFHVHRSLSHSVLVLAVIVIPILALTRKNPTVTRLTLLGAAGVLTHLALDLFGSYTPLLWPIVNQSIWISTKLDVHMGSFPIFIMSARLLTKLIGFAAFQSIDAPIVTTEGLGISLVLFIPSLVGMFRATARRRHTSTQGHAPTNPMPNV